MRLLLIRHAESAGNAAGIIQGIHEYPLSPQGEQQAALLAQRLVAGTPLDAVVASPLQRAAATARAVANETGHAVRYVQDLREYDFGEGNGMEFALARERYGDRPREPLSGFLAFPGEEGRQNFRERVCAAIWTLEAEFADATVAVISHAGPISVFCLETLGLPYRGRAPFAIHNTSITTIEVRGGRGTLHGLNDTCHLDGL